MPRPEPDQELLPSVLDRLIDREPRVSVEPEARQAVRWTQIKEAVRRDLEWLLNAKQPFLAIPKEARYVRHSLLCYGLPDFTTAALDTDEEQRRLLKAIEAAVQIFEPRLSQVSVTPLETPGAQRSLRFRIDGLLRVEPTPEPVSFNSMLRLPTKDIVVEED